MSGLIDLAASLVERARSGEDLEAYVSHQREFEVRTFQGAVDSISSAEPQGAGVRVISEGRVGFAYTTDLTDAGLNELVDNARTNSGFATPDEHVGLAESWSEQPPDIPGLVDEGFAAVDPDEKVAFALLLEDLTRSFDPRIRAVEEAVYADSAGEVAIATTTGITGSYRRTDAWCFSIAIATEGDDTEVGFEFDLARGLSGLDAEDVARRAAQRALSVLGASKIASASMPVIFDPYTAGQFLGVLGGALTAEAAQKQRSLFAGRLGEKVANAGLTLVDDGTLTDAAGSAPWDAEGVPTSRTEVIKDGSLASFLYDTTSARRDGTRSTGNAARAGFKGTPHPSPTNLAFESTGESRDDLLARAGKAFLVQDFHGVHSGANPISGDFSVGATGMLLEGGQIVQAVKEVTIAAPMLDILARIEAVATDRRWLPFGGSLGGATTLVSEMTVAGR